MTHRAIPAAMIIVALAACGDTGPAPATDVVETTDSAGVRITLHPAASVPDTVPDEPLLTIGREGDPEYELFRVNAVVGLSSGNVVVGNSGTRELRFYGPDGAYLRSAGGSGDGPDEIGFLTTIWPRQGDTLAVLDPRRRRVVYFDSAGSFVRGASFAEDLAGLESRGGLCIVPSISGLLADGTRVVRGYGCLPLKGADGVRTWEYPMLVSGEAGRDTVAVFGVEGIWERGGSTDPRERYDFLPFSAPFLHAVWGDRIFVSVGREYEVLVFDGGGRLIEKLQESAAPPPVTDADRAAYLDEREAAGTPHPDDVPFPERFGTYSSLVVAHGGDVWAEHQRRPGQAHRRWSVFPADGGRVRHVVLPDVRVESVRGGRVYALRTDDLGIQRVEVYPVPSSSSPPSGYP